MCGLCGVLSPSITNEQVEIFQGLMTVSTLRGPYGCGVAAFPQKGNKPVPILRHESYAAAEFVQLSEFYELFKKKQEYTCLMGHARMPTTGHWELAHTHPHQHNNIILAHNGTMKHVMGKAVDVKKDSDSLMLTKAIAEHGVDAALNKSDGGFAISYIDKIADTLNFVRNAERPLIFATAEDDNAIYWASERDMLRLVLKRRAKFKQTEVTFRYLKPGIVLSFRLHNMGTPSILHHRPLMVEKDRDPPDDHTQYMTCGTSFSREELTDILTAGCDNCTSPAIFDDYISKRVHFFAQRQFMCQDCLRLDAMAQQYFKTHGGSLPPSIVPLTPSSH